MQPTDTISAGALSHHVRMWVTSCSTLFSFRDPKQSSDHIKEYKTCSNTPELVYPTSSFKWASRSFSAASLDKHPAHVKGPKCRHSNQLVT
eukprot:347020-Amphidinium_carterae.1